jgi:hypothetical protein
MKILLLSAFLMGNLVNEDKLAGKECFSCRRKRAKTAKPQKAPEEAKKAA